MIKYLESMRNYFYKQYKNGKKKRISFESYNRIMKGGQLGEPAESGDKKYNLKNPHELFEFRDFVQREFNNSNRNNRNYKANYNSMKTQFINLLNNPLPSYEIFYIYNNATRKIIFIGIMSNNIIEVNHKRYKYIAILLRCPNTRKSGTIAICHILNNLTPDINGILLDYTDSSLKFYEKIGFKKILWKTSSIEIERLYLNKNNKNSLLNDISREFENTELISTSL
jgi:hypothetical protein